MPKIFPRLKKLEIQTRILISSFLKGEYHSVFKGSGIDFCEVRHYIPGDDVKLIDWKTTAKTNTPYIKLFEEERELLVFLIIDLSASQYFGTTNKLNKETILEIAAILGFSAASNNDCVGLIIFSQKVELYLPPKKGKRHLLKILQTLFSFEPKYKGTSIADALKFFLKINKKRAVVFLISDFIDQEFEAILKFISKKHDLIPIVVEDTNKILLPEIGLVNVKNEETGKIMLINTKDQPFIKEFINLVNSKKSFLKKIFNDLKLTPIYLNNNDNSFLSLNNYFKKRAKKY